MGNLRQEVEAAGLIHRAKSKEKIECTCTCLLVLNSISLLLHNSQPPAYGHIHITEFSQDILQIHPQADPR